MPKLYQSKVWLTKRYNIDKKTPEEIAAECNCSAQTIYVYLAKFGLKANRKGRK
jgi:DNA-binding CsgD family transcriptional regulator